MDSHKRKIRKFGDWELLWRLGRGGNGDVWACQKNNGGKKAIKILTKVKPKAYQRFTNEVTIIEQNSDIKGIIPIEEKNLPRQVDAGNPYYVMPLAENSERKLKGKPIEAKVEAIIQVSETLSELHKRKIFHRDIKPANILFYNSRFSLADFGLVDYPDKEEISMVNEEIGAKWTIAPEMRRDSSNANAERADIYSLAKTLWMYLTEDNKGFDGQYSTDSIIHLRKFYPESYTTGIDNLLIACTDNDPDRRPSAEEFTSALQEWKEIQQDFRRTNQQQWFEIQTKLFPTSIPKRVIWENVEDIIKVLKTICYYDNLNHMFFPDGGGLDLVDARSSHERDCIELDFGSVDIVKPKRLIFESFNFKYDWNYFRLELDNLQPTKVSKTKDFEESYVNKTGREDLSELSPLDYYPYHILENSSYYEEEYPITDDSRQVTRWLRGSFVIFSKASVYNSIAATYDGRHNKMNTEEFRELIQSGVDRIKELEAEKLAKEPF